MIIVMVMATNSRKIIFLSNRMCCLVLLITQIEIVRTYSREISILGVIVIRRVCLLIQLIRKFKTFAKMMSSSLFLTS